MKKCKSVLSILLVLVMLCSLAVVPAFAEGEGGDPDPAPAGDPAPAAEPATAPAADPDPATEPAPAADPDPAADPAAAPMMMAAAPMLGSSGENQQGNSNTSNPTIEGVTVKVETINGETTVKVGNDSVSFNQATGRGSINNGSNEVPITYTPPEDNSLPEVKIVANINNKTDNKDGPVQHYLPANT